MTIWNECIMGPIRQLTALLASYGLLLLANGMFTTLLSLRTRLEGFPTELIGVVMGSYFIGLFLGARYGAAVVNQVGHIRAFGVFASLISITPLVHMLVVSPSLWFVLRLIAGFSMAGLIVVTESWLNARAENHNRGAVLSIYMIINYLGAGSAQLLLMLDDPGGTGCRAHGGSDRTLSGVWHSRWPGAADSAGATVGSHRAAQGDRPGIRRHHAVLCSTGLAGDAAGRGKMAVARQFQLRLSGLYALFPRRRTRQ